jgi:hypothetical protein
MPDTYEVQAPDGSVLEIESAQPPTAADVLKAVRAYGDAQAAQMQERLAKQDPRSVDFWMPSAEGAGRFVSNLVETLNPLNLVRAAGSLVTHPVDTLSGMVGAQVDQGRQAVAKIKEPGLLSKTEAAGHALAAITPIVGPMAASAGEQIAAGDVAGGLGKGAGLIAPVAAGAAIRSRIAPRPGAADILTRQAEEQVSQRVLAPGNPAFRGRAAALAPDVLARKLKGGRPELQQAAEEGMADAGARIDDAIQTAGGANAQVSLLPVIGRLQQRIHDLRDSVGQPLSGQAKLRIDALNERITQLRALGQKGSGAASFEDLRKLRDESYRIADEARGYQKQGNPAMADEGWAARETGSAIRQTFADRSPAAAMANADYTFWKTLNDVLDPVQGRPKATSPSQGVTGGARTVGAVTGNLLGGKAGAFIGSTLIPWIKERVASPTWQLADAQHKLKLAQAMRRGDVGAMKMWMLRMEKTAAATSQSQSQMRPSPSER